MLWKTPSIYNSVSRRGGYRGLTARIAWRRGWKYLKNSLYHAPHSNDVVVGGRDKMTSLTQIVSQIIAITFELVKPVCTEPSVRESDSHLAGFFDRIVDIGYAISCNSHADSAIITWQMAYLPEALAQ
ncbi:hypothetical protein EVAR_51459_1 [Eumeta japonica]|uniref:Uncharacterized protein n=1 Tax=Eumeta variegata TaxID=151549 RepID=A0A4C1XU09_EUMVA|nr:hypothetical protein EVAR_51459_1 [Eumeta japonica]